jgi:hypothetical protein
MGCALADGTKCDITDAVNLRVKLLAFTWNFDFKILKGGVFPAILGLDFLTRTQMTVKMASREFSFNFAPEMTGTLGAGERDPEEGRYLQSVCNEIIEREGALEPRPSSEDINSIQSEFPALFSPELGTAKCTPYEIGVSDSTPVRSPPYRCAPPKLTVFRSMVNEHLEQG